MKKDSSGVRFGAICVGVAVCVVGARCARAQNALGDGRALDRNLQHGSGGVNTQVRDINALIRFNNAVVTGNAPGGRSFRGNAGYLASDDFRAATGTDALYNFRRDSATSALVASGIRGTDALQYQFSLSTGQAPPAAIGRFGDFSGGLPRGANPMHRPDIISSAAQNVTTGGTAATALRSTADYNTQQSLRPSVLGVRQDKDGGESILTASPLLGVNWTPIGTPGQAPTTPGATSDVNLPPSLTGIESHPAYAPAPPGFVQSMQSSRLDTQEQSPPIVMQELKRAIEENAKESSPNAERNKPAPTNVPLPGTTKPEDDASIPVWQRELDRIRKGLSGIPSPDETEAVPGQPDTTGNKDGKDGEKEKEKPNGILNLVEPTTGQINPDVLKALQATRPTVISLLPEESQVPNTYTAHMSRGEALLKSSQYFDAEDSFVRALAVKPSDPLANVGRIHAQLGASAFLTASANLKTLFAEHPEMIGTRYAPSLFPPEARIKTLAEQLRLNIKDPTSALGKESGMLMAYLGYQSKNDALVKEGLDAMAAKTFPEQKADVLLLGLMQKIWVEGRDLPPAPAANPPADKPAAPDSPAPDQSK